MTNRYIEQRIDSLFTAWDKPGTPGAAVLVMKNGKIIHKKGYGYAQLEYDIPIKPNTVFQVASVSKQFTAMAIALLAHQDKLSLDDEVRKYIPELKPMDYPVTIRHLVHHVSGWRDQSELIALAGWRSEDVITIEQIMKMLCRQQGLNFGPGSRFLYSNSGYTLMAIIVERVTGLTFPEYMQKNVFEPLNMNDSFIHSDHDLIVKNRAYSYAPKQGGGFRKKVQSYAHYGATSLYTTVEDMAKWIQNYEEPKVGAKVMSMMHNKFTLTNGETIDYAFGLRHTEYKGLPLISHTGSSAGFRAYFGRFPEHNLGITILSNASSFPREPMAMKIADILLADQVAQYKKPKPTVMQYSLCPGTYLVRELGKLLEITLENEKLMIQLEGWEQPIALTNIDENGLRNGLNLGEFYEVDKFVSKTKNVQIGFISSERKDDGLSPNSFGLIINTYGEDMGGEKIKLKPLTNEDLAEYEGTYYSKELDTVYHLDVADEHLTARHRRHSDIILLPTGNDQFHAKTGPLAKLRFVRNEHDQIVGVRNLGNRVLDILFEKR